MSDNPVVRNSAYCLAHVPDLVRFGSKPRREIVSDAAAAQRLNDARRSFEQAVAYAPNQTFIGNLSPDQLAAIPRPWFALEDSGSSNVGSFGEIVGQDLFYAALMRANVLEPPLVEIAAEADEDLRGVLGKHPVFAGLGASLGTSWETASAASIQSELGQGRALALRSGEKLRGLVRGDARAEGRNDANLDAHTLLEVLCAKTTGALALQWLLHREGMAASGVDYVISCGEEAAGDRYQRGGGGMAKAIGEMCGCVSASGMDVKNFCAAPASALIAAGALVKAGIYERVAVVAGGSLAKLGMKSPAFLSEGMPILDDCLGCVAFLVTADDGESPLLRLDAGAVGRATIGSSISDEAVYRDLILSPLDALGLTMDDVDKYAPELHNPEIMEYSGSGDVVHKNYRMIAAMAVLAGVIEKDDMASFIERIGMIGFVPTQGHIASGVPYIGHAAQAMRRGELERVMFLCKASLFLNRMTQLYDGVSFVLLAQRKKG